MVLYAEALFAWAQHHGHATLLAEADRIGAALERAAKLDRRFQSGTPERLQGTLATLLPPHAGGSLNQALLHFQAAIASSPNYLLNKLAYAEYYLARLHDRAGRRRILHEIIAADPSLPTDGAADNRAAQRRAAAMLKKHE